MLHGISSNSKLFLSNLFSFFSWKVLGAFKGFTWTHSRPRGESTPKDETIPERSGVRGDEASCDILAPSSKIVSFERIADERGYYSQGCERWIVEARDKRQWKVDTIMRLRYCEWFWDDIWVDRLRPPEWKYAIHSRIPNNAAAAAAAAVCIDNDKIYIYVEIFSICKAWNKYTLYNKKFIQKCTNNQKKIKVIEGLVNL